MGRAKGSANATTVDPRRLLSTAAPMVAGRDVEAFGTSRTDGFVAPASAFAGTLTDSDYLSLVDKLDSSKLVRFAANAARNTLPIASSAELIEPSSPKEKRYTGHVVLVAQPDGSYKFGALTTYGPNTKPDGQGKIWLQTDSLDAALNAVNEQLDKKRFPGGSSKPPYRTVSNGPGASRPERLRRDYFDVEFRRLCNV